ncbi:FAD-dependent oxidoreductase [Altererythrobacter sp. MF3-039]|uniref:FAD-dependent oxidoreductase n=1 Tax=Altererythrobacter sp. MF3-039 TaxID=3252901 RepID=UPI00390CD694
MIRENTTFEYSIPVVVAGGGACGCVAALAARKRGAEVLLIEQDAHPYGTTSMSQGLIAAAGTRSQVANGIEDSADTFFNDMMTKTDGQADPVIARALADHSGPTVDWLADECDIPMELDLGFHPSYGNSTYRVHGWPGHGGEDLLGLLHRRLVDEGVDVMLGTTLRDIHTDADGSISGLATSGPDGSEEQLGCGALVLACGGFAGNPDLVRRFIPELAEVRYNGHEGSHGDGIMLGAQIGGALADMGSYQGYAMLTDPQGITVPPGLLVEGGILLNRDGERFVDESRDIAGMMHQVIEQPEGFVWVIYDAEIEKRCLYIGEVAELSRLNAPRSGATTEELGAKLGIIPAILDERIGELFNARTSGVSDSVGRMWENARVPSPNYRALKVTGALYHTQGGLQIDGEARVVREDGDSIPNLFAGGGNARSVSGPSHWGYIPAMGLCTAVTLGRLAGQNAAAVVQS